jgi:NAD(P)-dependent dehydrogenase (short-subunit alcohol dehydrogenase family)
MTATFSGVAVDPATVPLAQLLRLDDRVAVVTGAGRGIGAAIARRLAEAGATVLLADMDSQSATATAAEICADFGGRSTGLAVNVTDEEQVRAGAQSAVDQFGRLDIWVNNAGVFPRLDAVDVTEEQFEAVLRVNVLGTQFGMAAAIRQMKPAGKGVVLNIASTAAYRGSGAYSASKWAVRGLTHGMASEVGRYGIRVVAVAPMATDTPGMSQWLASSTSKDDVVRRVASANPLGRMCQPDDVARAAVFLASDAAAYITGVTIPVDGGSLTVIP